MKDRFGNIFITITWADLHNQLALASDPRYTDEDRERIRGEEQRRQQRINETNK
jgi:hypothetical protein